MLSESTFKSTRDGTRRRKPRLIDTDWLVLRKLSKALELFASQTVGSGDRIIDFGCGDQPYRELFETRGADYIGADFGDNSELKISAEGTINAPQADADFVASFQVLEHVQDVGRYLKEAHRIAKKDGELILSTHGTWLFHPHPEDHRRWTRMGLISELKTYGWEVTQCTSIVGPLACTTLIRLTGFCFALRKIPFFGALMAAPLAIIMNLRGLLEDAITPSAIINDNACIYLVRARKRINHS
nr:class I SAM-dependent methyltransferase [uncultured Sphingorhabdus sp.]